MLTRLFSTCSVIGKQNTLEGKPIITRLQSFLCNCEFISLLSALRKNMACEFTTLPACPFLLLTKFTNCHYIHY